jgi:hypothetical protein
MRHSNVARYLLLFLSLFLGYESREIGDPNPNPNLLDCKYDYKVYVYPLPSSISPMKLAEEARHNRTYHICQKCIFEQFALEYVLYDFFTQVTSRRKRVS